MKKLSGFNEVDVNNFLFVHRNVKMIVVSVPGADAFESVDRRIFEQNVLDVSVAQK